MIPLIDADSGQWSPTIAPEPHDASTTPISRSESVHVARPRSPRRDAKPISHSESERPLHTFSNDVSLPEALKDHSPVLPFAQFKETRHTNVNTSQIKLPSLMLRVVRLV